MSGYNAPFTSGSSDFAPSWKFDLTRTHFSHCSFVMDPANFMGGAVIDLDLDQNRDSLNELPTWLRSLLDRALSASGIRSKRKVASDEAIESLEDVKVSPGDTCPICYDEYEPPQENCNNISSGGQLAFTTPKTKQMFQDNKDLIDTLETSYHYKRLRRIEENAAFRDPSLFLHADSAGLNYMRFPQSNLYTLENASVGQIYPGYEDLEKKIRRKTKNYGDEKHTPVKMPNCNHIFGKCCIIEWLKDNVSCPLCRKEVEELKEKDPKEKRLEYLKKNCVFRYSSEQEGLDHLLEHSTDVFSPLRRPLNHSITPLTDSYMMQQWATPVVRAPGQSKSTTVSREPNLVLPAKIPVSDIYATLSNPTRGFNLRRENTENEPDPTPINFPSPPPGAQGNGFVSRTTFPFIGRGGGPERRRGTPGGRAHPYSRPDSDREAN